MIEEPAGAFPYAARVCCASASLAARIEATEGRLLTSFAETPDDEVPEEDVEFVLCDVDDVPLELEPDVLAAGNCPGVPSKFAACVSTESALANPSEGDRKEA
jgi:hypothetical protein